MAVFEATCGLKRENTEDFSCWGVGKPWPWKEHLCFWMWGRRTGNTLAPLSRLSCGLSRNVSSQARTSLCRTASSWFRTTTWTPDRAWEVELSHAGSEDILGCSLENVLFVLFCVSHELPCLFLTQQVTDVFAFIEWQWTWKGGGKLP